MFENIDVSNPNIETKKDTPKTDNIFKELSENLDFGEEQNTMQPQQKKSIEDYLKQASVVLGVLNIFCLFLIAGIYGYIKIQNNPELLGKSFLDPICFLLEQDGVENTESSCSSVTALAQSYKLKSDKLTSDIAKRVLVNVNEYYAIENFIYSKEISFLLNTKSSKLKIMEILNEFDKLKNEFAPEGDKKIIQCQGVDITKEGILTMNCEAFSPQWFSATKRENAIVGITGDRNTSVIEGTSMTVAHSFINFIDKNQDSKFKVLESPKTLETKEVMNVGDFSYSTSFQLKLQYSQTNNTLSLY